MQLKDVRDKLAAKQDDLGKIFAEANNGEGQYDFDKVKCLGADVKGSIAVAEKVKALNSECSELAEQAETLEAAEKAASDHAGREKGRNRPPHASGGSGGEATMPTITGLSKLIGCALIPGGVVGEFKVPGNIKDGDTLLAVHHITDGVPPTAVNRIGEFTITATKGGSITNTTTDTTGGWLHVLWAKASGN